MAGVPVLCKAAMADRRSDLGEIENTGGSGWLVAWLVRRLIETWVATTEAVEQALTRAHVKTRQIVRIPNGVVLPDERSTRQRSNMVRRFLYLGRLSTNAQRDVPTLIKAFERLASTHPCLELAIVGAGDQLESTRQLVGASAAREFMHLPGFAEPEKWFAWADCFVLPSRREGLSNALLEAMAAGLPCIANDIPANREVLADGAAGILVPVEDVNALERAMRNLVQNGAMANDLALKARKRVEEYYSIRMVAESYLQLYRELRVRNSSR
jgi:glycosyltransferase involved in cell wall biosynthesis